MPCHCRAYSFPHRPGGGHCSYAGQHYLCARCGKPCDVLLVDVGIGPYEYWGSRGIDKQIIEVSGCCEATLLENKPGAFKNVS